MTWWLRLYPKRWRERYGQEFAALIQDRGWSLATGYDVLRSMLDAWLHPDLRPIQRLPARCVAGHRWCDTHLEYARQGSDVA